MLLVDGLNGILRFKLDNDNRLFDVIDCGVIDNLLFFGNLNSVWRFKLLNFE